MRQSLYCQTDPYNYQSTDLVKKQQKVKIKLGHVLAYIVLILSHLVSA
jgi:hypothetical protein